MIHCSKLLCLLLIAQRLVVLSAGDTADVIWKCDDLTPDLCDDLPVETGYVKIRPAVRVKYWRYGSATREPPLVVANGGPGYPHTYVIPLKQIACRGDRQVIFYDQAGCGESPVDKTVTGDRAFLLGATYYAREELPTLLREIGVGPFHLLGHSWGTMLALEFAINSTHPSRNDLLSLVLASPVPDMREYIQLQWDEHQGTIGRMLPPFVRQRLKSLVSTGDFMGNAEYNAISDLMWGRFLSTTTLYPDCIRSMIAGTNEDIYMGMQGAGEYSEATGTLRSFRGYGRLSEVDVPVLLLAGEYDVVRPFTLEKMHGMLGASEIEYIATSGHFLTIDNPGALNNFTSDFIARVDAGERIGMKRESPGKNKGWSSSFVQSCITLLVGAGMGFVVGKRQPEGYESIRNAVS